MFCLKSVLVLTAFSTSTSVLTISRSSENRIFGGTNASIEDHPYQVSLRIHGAHICGGSLIRPDVVITAAHCMQKKGLYRIQAGTSDLDDNQAQLIQVKYICRHPKYTGRSSNYDYDIAVLKLTQKFNMSATVQTIQLQEINQKIPAGTLATITGWGFTNREEISRILQKLEVSKMSRSYCNFYFWKVQYLSPHEDRIQITDRMTCYEYNSYEIKSPCSGDSGSPLVVNKKLVGIASWNLGCSPAFVPTVYTRIENKEISEHVQKCLKIF